MRIEINEPQAVWELGQQAEQKNSIYPPKGEADQADRIFIVSDGHADNGLTSKQFIKNISGYFKRYRSGSGEITDEDIQSALDTCQPADGSAPANGLSFAMVCIHPEGITVVSTGNCRCFQVRPSVKRVIFASPASDKATILSPNITHLEDIEPDDYFVILTNGMMEKLDENAICEFFSEEGSDDKKRNILRSGSSDNKNNHTVYFFKVRTIVSDDGKDFVGRRNIVIPEIKSVKPISNPLEDDEDEDEVETVKPEETIDKVEKEPKSQPQKPATAPKPRQTNNQRHQPRPISRYEDERKSNNMRIIILVAVIIVLAIAAGALWYFNSSSTNNLPADSSAVETQSVVDTTKQQTTEPADSAMIPDTAIAEPELNKPLPPVKKRTQVNTKSADEEESTMDEESEATEPAEAPTEHKTEAEEPAKTKPAATEAPASDKSSTATKE